MKKIVKVIFIVYIITNFLIIFQPNIYAIEPAGRAVSYTHLTLPTT